MEFLKARSDYVVVYNKQQAIKQLRLDKRIQKITSTRNDMIITTVPVILDNEYCKYPIGTFSIKIKQYLRNIDIRIKRLEGYIGNNKYLSYHIRRTFDNDDKICWGSLEEDIYEIKEHKDWFWLVKCALEILYDNDDVDDPEDFIFINYGLQLNYLYIHNNKKVNRKIKQLLEKEINKDNQIYDNEAWWMKSHNAILKKTK